MTESLYTNVHLKSKENHLHDDQFPGTRSSLIKPSPSRSASFILKLKSRVEFPNHLKLKIIKILLMALLRENEGDVVKFQGLITFQCLFDSSKSLAFKEFHDLLHSLPRRRPLGFVTQSFLPHCGAE